MINVEGFVFLKAFSCKNCLKFHMIDAQYEYCEFFNHIY